MSERDINKASFEAEEELNEITAEDTDTDDLKQAAGRFVKTAGGHRNGLLFSLVIGGQKHDVRYLPLTTKKILWITLLILTVLFGAIGIGSSIMPKEVILENGSTAVTYAIGKIEIACFIGSIVCLMAALKEGVNLRKATNEWLERGE